jgi:Tfp pilus assembly ATPase PilU
VDEVEDINELIRELNEDRPSRGEPGSTARLEAWLQTLVERAGSDLLLVAGAPPAIRVDGRIVPLPHAPLSGEEIEEAVLPTLSSRGRSRYAQESVADLSFKVRGTGRFRINLHRERGRPAAAIRALPTDPPRLSTLGLPPGAEALTRLPRGLVLRPGVSYARAVGGFMGDADYQIVQFDLPLAF